STASGTLTFRDSTVSDLDGAITWTKTSRATDVFYPAGFTAQLPSVGARYTAPVAGTRVLAVTQTTPNSTAALGDGNLAQPISVETALMSNNRVITPTPNSLNFS